MIAEPIQRRPHSYQSGLGMIEVLVSMLILSIGLLSMASLQVTSTQVTSQSARQTKALFLAESMVEMIRANPDAIDDYDGMTIAKDTTCTKAFAPEGNATSVQKAAWRNDVVCQLGNVEGAVSADGSSNNVVVELNWKAPMTNPESEDDTHTLRYKANL